jgi:hypothetical protein
MDFLLFLTHQTATLVDMIEIEMGRVPLYTVAVKQRDEQ